MSTTKDKTARKRVRIAFLLGLGALLCATGLAAGAWWKLSAGREESTDDAYVAGNIIQITPQLAGTVQAINADDTDFVRAGAPLVVLDRADAHIALEEAEAQLAQTVRRVRTLYSKTAALNANMELHQAALDKAQKDLERRLALSGTGGVSTEEIEHGRAGVRAAQAALTAAREQLAADTALTDHTKVADHPDVRQAAARVEAAYLALRRTVIPAPASGLVARRSVQVGGRVSPGQTLMAIVPLDQLWVDANFKEDQFRRMRIGQPVGLTADLYGDRVSYHGTVVGLGAGTGSAFTLLPAQNATGHWIKVVQRVPVRIALDPRELRAHPLRIGLSMQVDVDVSDTSGTQLASVVRNALVAQTSVFDDSSQAVATRIRQIIRVNLHGGRLSPLTDLSTLDPHRALAMH